MEKITLVLGGLMLLALSGCSEATPTGGVRAESPVTTPTPATQAKAETPKPPDMPGIPDLLNSAAAPAEKISIDNFTFTPQKLTITRGTTVTWVNRDDVPHTVRSTEKKFASGTLDTDDTFSFTFNEPGVYPYFCTVHAHMTGEITVK